jgi:ESCRT-II complex subunit VPS25
VCGAAAGHLNAEARTAFLSALVDAGNGEWLDPQRSRCLVLWRKLDDWAELVYKWVRLQRTKSRES